MVATTTYNGRLYPDFDAPADPRYTSYPNAHVPPMTTAESERLPLTSSAPAHNQPDPSNAYYVPPSYGPPLNEQHCHHPYSRHHRHHHCREHGRCKGQGFILSTLKLGLFHLLNAILGVVAFVAVVTSVHVAIGLIPLCCVGLLVFRGVVLLVQWLAKLDVKLSNYAASSGEERVLMFDTDQPLGGFEGLRLSPELAYFSPVSLLGALYFSTVKFVVSILSLVIVSVFASLPIVLLGFIPHHETVDLHQYPFTFYVMWGCLFILSIVAMHVVAWLSRALTHFFCCERVTASEYTIPIVQYPETATTMYGSSVPTRTNFA
ncbi:hypothetical protein PHMEG_00033145 [Phytophthora megakarya]|uniref:Transmembrane protein n=1 Tax=Phytophthora megakarya TaxID=4795 RepID=A0A225UUF4_9STRA|nr:hypothetical protein PHMEG_00033145 [Phytophthora megakarya]